jgi:tetratricopeptide (TPR) repeat protein
MRLVRFIMIPAVLLLFAGFVLLALSCASLRGSSKTSMPVEADSTSSLPGKLIGKVVDANTDEGLPNAKINILGSNINATADGDGNYQINEVPPGVYTVQVNMVGFKTIKKKGVKIKLGEVTQETFEIEMMPISKIMSINKNDPKTKAYLAEQEKKDKEVIRQNPNDANGYAMLAFDYDQQGRTREAITELRKAVSLHPELSYLHIDLSVLLDKVHKLDEAKKEYRIGVSLDADDPITHQVYADWLVYWKEYEEAIVEFNKTIQLGDSENDIRRSLGDLYSHFGRWDEAEKEYRECYRVECQFDKQWDQEGFLLSEAESSKERVDKYKEALRLNPKDGKAKGHYFDYLNRYGYYLFKFKKSERYDEALKTFEEIHKLKPKMIYVPFYMACCYAALGDKEKAIALLLDNVKKGFNDWEYLITYKELDDLRADSRFKEMEKTVKERWEKKPPRRLPKL